MSIAAVALNLMQPIGLNWCWIPPAQRGLRYGLAQCWWLAIVFLTISSYLFMWYLSKYPRAARTVEECLADQRRMLDKPSNSSDHPTELAQSRTKDSDHSEFMLPIQGLKGQTDGTSDSSSPSIQARCRDKFNAFRALPPTARHATTGPHYHSQCPKVSRSFDVAVVPSEARSPLVPSPSLANDTGPHYHNQCPKVTKSYDISSQPAGAQSSISGPHYHNQCPKVTKTVQVAVESPRSPRSPNDAIKYASSEDGSFIEGGRSNATKRFNVLSILAETHTDSSSETVPLVARGSGAQHRNQSLKEQPSFEGASEQSQITPLPSPGPHYHNQCPKVTRAVDVSSAPSGPSYHNQCPKVTRSVDIVASTPADAKQSTQPSAPDSAFALSSPSPRTPSLPSPIRLRPDPCASITTITSPLCPPPSPTPGLPPPPWSHETGPGGATSPRRKTFLLSHSSTWSDWTPSTTSSASSTPGRRLKHISSNRGSANNASAAASAVEGGRRPAERALFPLAAFPLAYAVLSFPGVVQSLMEVSGARDDHAAAMMVGVGQYVGLAHAVTFGAIELLKWKDGVKTSRSWHGLRRTREDQRAAAPQSNKEVV